jgi:dolichyl-phosphate-mannose-protein mannosyltransferase
MAIRRERLRVLALGFGLLAALAAYGAFVARNAAHAVGGSDSSGYANTARRLLSGTLVARPRSLDLLGLPDSLAPVATPLGFLAGPRPGTMAPLYPIGFPAHLAAAALAGGWEKGPYLVSPIAAVVCLALLYLLSRELGLPPAWSAGTTAVLAAWPAFLFQAIQPMSDVVATLWATAAILFAVRARRRPAWALACGAALGLAVLVRPTSLLLAVPLAFAVPRTRRCLGLFVLGGAPMAAVQAAMNLTCYGGLLATGYGKTGHLEAIALANFPARIWYYGRWIFHTFTLVVPLAAVASAADRRTPGRDRAMLLSWFGVFLVFYCFYGPYESFGFLRFLLPGIPALVLAAVLGLRAAIERIPRSGPRTAIAVVALAAVMAVECRQTRLIGVLGTAETQATYPLACRWASARLPGRSVVVATYASGALEYYTKLPYARWDPIAPDRWPTLRGDLESHGWRFYALLFPEEEKELSAHVPGAWRKVGAIREVGIWELPPLEPRISARE